VAIFGLGGNRPRCASGHDQAKAGRIIAIDTNPAKLRAGSVPSGATECLHRRIRQPNSRKVSPSQMTGWGVDHTFECNRQRQQ